MKGERKKDQRERGANEKRKRNEQRGREKNKKRKNLTDRRPSRNMAADREGEVVSKRRF